MMDYFLGFDLLPLVADPLGPLVAPASEAKGNVLKLCVQIIAALSAIIAGFGIYKVVFSSPRDGIAWMIAGVLVGSITVAVLNSL